MRIAIVGAGGVGCYFGGRLAQAGEEVVFVARGGTAEALRRRGLKVDSLEGGFSVQPARVAENPHEAGAVDAVLLCVKTWQVAEVARALPPLLGPSTCVIPLQNGVEAPATLATELGSARVLGGLCSLIVFTVEPGHVRHAGGKPSIKFGELDGRVSERVERLRRAFAQTRGVEVEVPADIEVALWEKFLFIASWGGIGALTRAPVGVIREQAGTRRMLLESMQEIFEVARARKVNLQRDVIDRAIALIDSLPADSTASMQRDILSGQPSELEAQTGAAVRLGREAGIETPVNALVYDSLSPLELRARGQLAF